MKVIVISDVHCPFHDEKALLTAYDFIHEQKPDLVIVNGDMVDFSSISNFVNVNKPTIHDEIKTARDKLEELRDYHPGRIIFIPGNHEWRWVKFINETSKELSYLREFALDNLLHLESLKINYIPPTCKESFILLQDRVYVGHFNKASKYSGYTAKNLLQEYGKSVIQGHTHRLAHIMQSFSNTGEILHGLETGCLCKTNPEYLSNANWQQGFVMFELSEKYFFPQLIIYQDGRLSHKGVDEEDA